MKLQVILLFCEISWVELKLIISHRKQRMIFMLRLTFCKISLKYGIYIPYNRLHMAFPPHNILYLPHYILHYNISQLVNWAVNYERTMDCLLWPTVWPISCVNTIKPNSLWEKSTAFVSLIKDNDILSSNMPLAITLCTDVRPKHLWTVSMAQCHALWLASIVTAQEVKV